jgi:hypothetical protein
LFGLCAGYVRRPDAGELAGDAKWDAGFGCSVIQDSSMGNGDVLSWPGRSLKTVAE